MSAIDTKRGLYEDCPDCTTLRARVAAQLAELHAISDALGTNEGHSSVDHIKDLRAEVERLRGLLRDCRLALRLHKSDGSYSCHDVATLAKIEDEEYCRASHPRRPVKCQLPKGHDGEHQWAGQSSGLSWRGRDD
jgi:hypothetical protein